MMKKFIILLIASTCVSARFNDRFNNHLRKHGKNYDNVPDEIALRRQQNYLDNMDFVENHNKGKHGFKLGSNEYMDRNKERFVDEMCKTQLPPSARALPAAPAIYPPTTPAAASVNWNGYSQPIVNQGGCGSCWAFAAIATIEYYNAIRNYWRQAISQQNLVDCDPYDGGCNGGWPQTAMNFLKNNYSNRIASACDYPYTSGTTKVKGICKAVPTYVALNYVRTFGVKVNGNEALMRSYVSNYGPVAIAMYVSRSGLFQGYKTGIHFDSSCPVSNATYNQCDTVNHGMVAVGYGTDASGAKYWLVRNSWGTTWGEAGYIRMAMDRGNNCNVACWAIGLE